MDKGVVSVTGGASGIGLGVCKLFAAQDHAVVILDLQAPALKQEGEALRSAGHRVLARKVDVSAPPSKRLTPTPGASSARAASSSQTPAIPCPRTLSQCSWSGGAT